MAAKRKLMMLEGHLEGMGRREECSVMAMRVSAPGQADRYEYAKACIHRGPKELPDGLYTIVFNGERDHVRLVKGRWHAAEPAVQEWSLPARVDLPIGPKSHRPEARRPEAGTNNASFEVA